MATKSYSSVYFQDTNEVTRVFNRFDANGDGMISSDELASVMQALGSNSSPDQIASMMHEIDTDCDGFINLDEFSKYCKGGDNDYNDDDGIKELQEAFEMYDGNKNGLISS